MKTGFAGRNDDGKVRKKKQQSLIVQVFLLVLAVTVVIGVVTHFSQFQIQRARIKAQLCAGADEAAGEVISSLREYPAYKWLLRYWTEHADELEIEYDAAFTQGSLTEEKCQKLLRRHPDLHLRYCDAKEAEDLPEEDQRLYAEIIYSWMIDRLDAIKQNLECDYLYFLITDTEEGDHPYETECFIMSAADPGAVRGTEYGQVYTLGVTASLAESSETQEVMQEAVEAARTPEFEKAEDRTIGESIRSAGNYVDYYTCMELTDRGKRAYLVGSTYKVSGVLREIQFSVLKDTVVAALYQFLLMNLIIGYLLIFVLRPLKQVLQSIRSYTDSKDSRAVEKDLQGILVDRRSFLIRRNEIGQLTDDFVTLTKEIDDYTDQIEQAATEKQRLAFELETAAEIQLEMLPDTAPEFPGHPEFELSASMTPAKVVGGDFYDYFLTDEDHLALVIADVSDKGIPAALFMAQAKALIKSQAQYGSEPAQILSHVNEQLNEVHHDKCFVSVWLAIIDLRTGEGLAANAGHEHPALCRKGESFELVIYKHSLVVGMVAGVPYRQHAFKLNPGDLLYVYTDGVPEASNESQEQFGTERMLEALNRNKDKAPADLLAAVSAEIDAFMNEAARFDDTTMMCLRYHETADGQIPDQSKS